MRVAELTTYTSRLNGGVFYALTTLLPEVARAMPEAQLRVFGYKDPHTEEDRHAWAPLGLEAFAPWPPRHFGYSPRFYPALEEFDADVVHAHGLWTYLSAAALRLHRRKGTPVVISPHGMLDAWALGFSRSRKRIAARLFQDSLLNSAAVMHALTLAEARSIRDYGLKNPIVVIPNGVNLPRGQVSPAPWTPSSPGRDRVLLFLARIHPKKGLDLLLEAWPEFSRSGGGRRWRLVIAGWDEIGHEPELKAMASARGILDSVEFVGPLFGPRKEAALSAANAFILPSRSEGLPMAVLEAWAHAKPVLMTGACNLPEGVSAGAAIEMEPTSLSVAAGLDRLAGMNESALSAMGIAGQRLAADRFSWGRIAADMSRVYRSVAARTTLPPDLLFGGSAVPNR
jgi:poly(glycerol-phosphate) alpha-glucosyltransferase